MDMETRKAAAYRLRELIARGLNKQDEGAGAFLEEFGERIAALLEESPFEPEKVKPSYEIDGDHVRLVGLPGHCNVVIAGFHDMQFQPRHVRLPHQIKVSDLARLSKQGRGDVMIYPADSTGAVTIERHAIAQIAMDRLAGE